MLKVFWNGIGLPKPDEWELTSIGQNRLAFHREDRPVLDVQWKRAGGPVNFAQAVDTWKRTCRKSGDTLSLIRLPERLSRSSAVEWDGFEWDRQGEQGIDILRCCTLCRTVTVFRWMYPFDSRKTSAIDWASILPILGGFTDHGAGSGIRFALYDIELNVPETFRLERFAFHPGLFELQFHAEHGNIRFLRWAAAAELLRNQSLESFGERVNGKAHWSRIGEISEDDALVGHPLPRGWMDRIVSARHRSWLLIRHDVRSNRILGIHYRGKSAHQETDIQRFGRMFSIRSNVNHSYRHEADLST